MAQVEERSSRHKPLGALSKITIAALLGNACAYLVYLYLVTRVTGFITPILIISLVTVLVAGLIATGRRWFPLLGALLALVSSSIDLAQSESAYNLAHPADFDFFSVGVLILACALIAFGAGVGATIQSYRGTGEHILPLFRMGVTVLSGLVLGMLLVSAIVAANPQNTSAGRSGSTVHMGPGQFLQPVAEVPKGGKLTIIDDGQFEHVLANGEWKGNGTASPMTERGAVPLHSVSINSGSVEVGPFNTAGVFHIYCTIHRGMNLIVDVS